MSRMAGGGGPVTVIGLGPMGRAMAATLIKAGREVTVWNRTPGRADELVALGAGLAAGPAEAVSASRVIILSLTDYRAMYDVLDAVDTGGKVMVNLSSDTPEMSRAASAWAAERGAGFLTGGVMVPAPMIGAGGAYAFYSGPESLFRELEPVLGLIGEPRYLGADPGLAQLFYQAHLDVFLTALSGLLHATALVTSAGVGVAEFLPGALAFLSAVPELLGEETVHRLESGDYEGGLSSVAMMGATADHIARTSEQAGIDLALPRAIRSHYEGVLSAGGGARDWTSIYEVIKSG